MLEKRGSRNQRFVLFHQGNIENS